MRFLMFPNSWHYADWGFLLLRMISAAVFFSSGSGHLKAPQKRAESLGLSVSFTIFLGCAEVLGALGNFIRRADAMGGAGIDSDHVRLHLYEGGEMEDRVLGREFFWLALRFDLRHHQPGDPADGWRTLYFEPLVFLPSLMAMSTFL